MPNRNIAYFQPGDVVVLRYVETPKSAPIVHAVLGDPASIGGEPFLAGGKVVTVGARPYRVVSDSPEQRSCSNPKAP